MITSKRVTKPKRKKPGEGTESWYVLMQSFWSITQQTAYKWKHAGKPIHNPVAMAYVIAGEPRASVGAKTKSLEVLETIQTGGKIDYGGKFFSADDTPEEYRQAPDDEPATEINDGRPLTIDELIQVHSRDLAKAMKLQGAARAAKIAEIQPMFLKAVQARDNTELAAKKLGIDSLEMIPRDKFAKLLRIMTWAICNRVDTVAERISKATTGLVTTSETYTAAHPIIFKYLMESPLCEIAHYSTELECPEFVLTELKEAFADFVASGEKKLDLFLEIRKAKTC